jgi:hypothetical protein
MTAASISFISLLRDNQGLVVGILLCLSPLLVLALVGSLMRSAGASLRPIFFIGGLMLPVVLPFLIGQLVLARVSLPQVPSAGLAVRDGRFVDREKLFGTGVPAEYIREAKSGMSGILDEAEVAEVGITLAGETVLVAQFATDEQAERAGAVYHRGYGLHNTSGDDVNGWRATRMQGDFIEMLRTGRQLFVWSGLTPEAAAARRAASDLEVQFPNLKPTPRPALFPSLKPIADFFAPVFRQVLGVGLLVLLYTIWFFKGSSWAASTPAVTGTKPVSEHELVSRLMSINDLDVPFTISHGASPNELIADWRYADAKWIDLAGAHGMRRTFRVRFTLDESAHTARATDFIAEWDVSAGRGGASIKWKAATGIVFFQKEQQSVVGLQIDDQGRFKPTLSYAYKFDLNEMKSPIVTTITRAGWNWRPTVWNGPSWLRWLTQ